MLGLIAQQGGRNDLAIDYIHRAIGLHGVDVGDYSNLGTALRDFGLARPDLSDAHNNLGAVLYALGRPADAEASWREALRLRPDCPEAHNNLGGALQALGRPTEAEASYREALRFRPDYPEAHNNLGTALYALNRPAEAEASHREALRLRPDYHAAHVNLGTALMALDRPTEAEASYREALRLRPDYPEAHSNLGGALYALNRPAEAEASHREALRLRPDHPEALNNRAIALKSLKRFDEALESCDRALMFRPDYAEALVNRGVVLTELSRLEEALESYDRALGVRPDYAEALVNRGAVLRDLSRLEEALENFDRALAIRPDHELWRAQRALLVLRLGRFSEGLEEYEYRRKTDSWEIRSLPGPEWTDANSAGKLLFFYSDGGLGDTIHFSRFACNVAATGREVILEVQAPLGGLLKSLKGVRVIRRGEQLPEYDAHLPLMSLPHVLRVTPETIPANVPYLFAEPTRAEAWAKRLPPGQFRVGIVWQGNPAREIGKDRSLPLSAFAALSRVPGVTLISLQKHDGLEQLAGLPREMKVETLGADFDAGPDAFLDTAAVMMNLDLVISADTATAHLAGALGCPLWIALKQVPEWRWMMDREDTPWYPTARLFRQTRRGDWEEVFTRIATEINQVISGKREVLPEIRPNTVNLDPPKGETLPHGEVAGPPTTVLKECRHGRMLFLKRDIYVGRSLDLYGEYSEAEAEVFTQLLRLGDVVIEVGANIGAHTVHLSKLVGSSGMVLAFEPQRVIFQLLCANIALNELFNVHTYHGAVGRETGCVRVPSISHSSGANFGGVSVSKSGIGEEVQLWKLDAFAMSSLKMLKVDVEGMKIEVLEGASRSIDKYRPILYVENDRKAHSEHLITLINALGYEMWWHLPPLYNPNNFAKNKENVFNGIVSCNLLCFPKEAPPAVTGTRRVSGPTDWWK
jgi:FkbM family methyltransferase